MLNTVKNVQYLKPLFQCKKYEKDFIINDILQKMLPLLDNQELDILKKVLNYELSEYIFVEKKIADNDFINNNEDLIKKFLTAKKIEGRSDKTIEYYKMIINKLIETLNKSIDKITTENLREYLINYQQLNNSSKVTIDNMRRIFNSFFTWLEEEDYIIKNPVKRIHKIKTPKIIKETFTDEELEIMRQNCKNERDLALLNLLISTGIRVGEVINLNREDINFTERECVVFGKGAKERIVYFDARTKIHLKNYLESRNDTNPALFVSLHAPFERLQISGVEVRLREFGEELNINKVHPHKFRRTLATMAIDKGMPIEQLQRLLGHEKIDTTMHYAMVKQSNVKLAHRKFIS